jgi:hypothetical protein
MFTRNGLRFLNNVFQVPNVTYTIACVLSITHFKWRMQLILVFIHTIAYVWSITQYGTSEPSIRDLKWKIKPKWPYFKFHKNKADCCLLTADITVLYATVTYGTSLWYSSVLPYKDHTRSYCHQLNIIHEIPIILWNKWIKVYWKLYDTRYGTFSTVPNLYLSSER